MPHSIALIAAVSQNRVVGKQGALPWRLPNDLAYFKALTLNQTVIMGRKTFESIGKPLPNRNNIVLSRQPISFSAPNAYAAQTLNEALDMAKQWDTEIFIIGGESVYREGLAIASRLYLTEIETYIEHGDAFFPEFSKSLWRETQRVFHSQDAHHAFNYSFVIFEKTSAESTENR